MKLSRTITSTALVLLIGACGGGGGATNNVQTSLTGTVIDAPIRGLIYTGLPSNTSNTTDSSGRYTVSANDTTVHFCLPTSSSQTSCTSSQAIFSYAPSTSNNQIVVTDLLGGIQVAQLLQSVGQSSGSGSSSVLDVSTFVSNPSNTPLNLTNIQQWIASGGTATQPTFVTVTPTNALQSVATYLTSLPTTSNIPSGYFNSSTFFHMAPCQNALMFGSFDANGLWTNWLNQTTASSSVSGPTITFTQTTAGTTYRDVATFPILSPNGGTFTSIQTTTPLVGSPTTQTCNGVFTKVNSSSTGFTLSNLANKRLTVNLAGDGHPHAQFCSDNKIIYTFGSVQNNSLTYTRACNTNATRTNLFQTNGSVTSSNNGLAMPAGLVVLSDSNTYVMGMVNGGTLASGSAVMTFMNGSFKYYNGVNGPTPYPVIAQFLLQ
jgi:hypothetical protein